MNCSGIYTLSEAGKLKKWGSRQTLSKACADGKLPFRKIGRVKLVHESALDFFAFGSKMIPSVVSLD